MDKNHGRILSLFPLLLGCVYLIAATFNREFEHALDASVLPIVVSLVCTIALIVPLAIGLINRNAGYCRLGFNTLCYLTPLSLIFPWVVAPGNLGMSYGGYGFFLEWLTKYPNFGKINIEVFIGILCVPVSSLLPGIYCYLYTFKKRYRKSLILVVIIEIAAYLPVLVKLDWLLFLSGVMGNPWFGGGSIRELSALTGPSLRLASFLTVAGTVITTLRKRNISGNRNGG